VGSALETQGIVREPSRETEDPGSRRALLTRHAPLAGVLGLSALLNTWALSQNGYANTFYSAAVESMLRSWHNFVFVSFDPGGLITVDKPPLALWAQAASARVFGLSPLALLLPEALAGVAGVGALYWGMRRPFGRNAALFGALALAVFPAYVAVVRDNGPDPLLILLMTLACAVGVRATEGGGTAALLGSAALVGLAFNTKTLAAYLVVPPLALAFALCAPGTLWRRLGQLALAGVVLAALSLAWVSFVDLTPASQRPYVGGSLDNSELGLTFAYNGLGRVDGQEGTAGRIAYRPGAALITAGGPEEGGKPVTFPSLDHGARTVIRSEAGRTGPLRLFDRALGGQDGWMLPFALLSLLALAVGAWRGLRRGTRDRRDPAIAGLVGFGGWFAVEVTVLSLARGIVHPYYVSALAPATAAMVGAGAALLVRLAGRRGGLLGLLALALAATAAVQAALLARAGFMVWLIPLLAIATAITLVVLLVPRGAGSAAPGSPALEQAGPMGRSSALWARLRARPALVAGMMIGVLMVAPALYSATTWLAPVQGTFPAAGPHEAAGPGGVGLYAGEPRFFKGLVRYVRAHRLGSRFAVLTVSSVTAAPLILMGVDAAALGGYGGTDPALDRRQLARLVSRGEAHYVLLGGAYSERGGNSATVGVLSACQMVPASAWDGPPLERYSLVLFDCAGHAGTLARRRPAARLASLAHGQVAAEGAVE